jgi:5'-nucleotidase
MNEGVDYMKLLLTNDDGINAKGLYILAKELEKEHDIIIAAPDDQRSACGHSITLTRPLVIKEIKLGGIKSRAYSVDGTPADCVRIAVDKLVDGKVDMVISGINKGVNLGTDVIYSGTVSAAIEAAIYKIPSVAISSEFIGDRENYELAAITVLELITKLNENNIGNDIVLNINVPLNSNKQTKVCKIGNRTYNNCFIEKVDNDGNKSYDIIGDVVDTFEENTDVGYFKKGYTTITPLHYDLTNFNIINEVESWL